MPESPATSQSSLHSFGNRDLSTKDLIVLFLMPSITWLFFIQVFRSIIISSGIFISLLPIIGTLLASFFLTILIRRYLNSPFLVVLGGSLLILGRGFLLIPDETMTWYFTAMIIGCAGMPLFLAGIIGNTMLETVHPTVGTGGVHPNILLLSLGGSLSLATGLSLLLRAPGIELMENPGVVLILMLLDVILLYRWSELFPRDNFARNLKKDGFRKESALPHATLRSGVILLLAPIFFYLLLRFDRPEWIAAASIVPYGWTSYAVALSLMVGSFCPTWITNQQKLHYVALGLNGIGFIAIGLMFYLPPGPYLLVLIMVGTAGVGLFLSQFLVWWKHNTLNLRPNLSLFFVFVSLTFGLFIPFALEFELYMPFYSLICSAALLSGIFYYLFKSKQAKGGKA